MLEPFTSRLMTEAELESISNVWRGDLPIPEITLDPILDQSFAVNLAGYGSIYFLSLLDNAPPDRKSAFSHWLIEADRVRWELPISDEVTPTTYIPHSLDAVVFTELNFDGLGDIYTIASYVTGVGQTGAIPFPVVTLYVQQEDGSFVILEAESLEISSFGLTTVAEVEDVLRGEMNFLP
ncbi:MAG: hypothetical protein HC924_04450 [Synechococcaceae cyanobacterium SM2_3_2]|nr:hypothetical protein [Synechococcaceae cyanobacterium SM2_3_2]